MATTLNPIVSMQQACSLHDVWGPFSPFLPIVCLLTKVKTPSLLPNGRTHTMPCQCGVHAQLKVFCVLTPRDLGMTIMMMKILVSEIYVKQ